MKDPGRKSHGGATGWLRGLPQPVRTLALWHPRYWGMWFGVLLLWGIAWLPVRWRMALGAWLGRQMGLRNAKRERIVGINLRLCFPELDEAARTELARAAFERAGQAMLDLGYLWLRGRKALERRWRVHGLDHLQAAQRSGRALLVVTGHVVGLDVGGVCLSKLCGGGAGPYNPTRKPFINAWMTHGRTRFGATLMARQDGLRPLVKALKSGTLVYYIPDEDLGPEHAVFVPFFGVPKATVPMLGRLARLGDAVVLPYITRLDPKTGLYHIHVEPPLADFPSGDALADTARMNEVLERMIRVDPSQYMWGFKLFKTRPSGEVSPYTENK
ncbi:MAG: lysophospholipid acyltransferase family protein [Pseudomonadota bacterium]